LFQSGSRHMDLLRLDRSRGECFCLGQLSIGVVNICQLGVGVISINQAGAGFINLSINAGVGVISFGLAVVGILFSYGLAAIGFISNGLGFYKFEFGTPTSEAETFFQALKLLEMTINRNPVPFAIWTVSWFIVILVVYNQVKNFIAREKMM
jgi:hypothetical protein